MIERKDIIADLHTHTVGSGHAFSTVSENLEHLKALGNYKYMAVTDHFYNDGSPLAKQNECARLLYCADRFNHWDTGITVINGAEFNIGHYPEELWRLDKLNWKVAGLHSWTYGYAKKSLKEVLDEIMFTFSLPFIKMNCLAHIEREIHKIDNGKVDVLLSKEVCNFYDTLIDFCKQNNIYMEVNESSLVLPEGGSIERMLYWVRKARDNGNMISLGTDAHSCYEVGKFDNVAVLLNELNYPKDLILNCDNDKIQDLLKVE